MDSAILDISTIPFVLLKTSRELKPKNLADVTAFLIFAVVATILLLKGIAWDRPDPHRYVWYEKPQQLNDAITQRQDTRDISKKVEETNKKVVIFWGSQSGTAERFANQLAKECQARFGLASMAADLSDYDPQSIASIPNHKIVLFILSTYGEGDPSDNANSFWEWIRTSKSLPLKNLQYAAFGLGNSNYKYYNRVVDVAVECLNISGAHSLMPVAKADDALQTTEEDFVSWKEHLFSVFKSSFGVVEQTAQYQPSIAVVEDELLEHIDVHHGEPSHPRANAKSAASSSPIKAFSIKTSRELFNSSKRKCIHMEIDVTEHPEIHYKTGDHLAVWPTNPNEEVDNLLNALGVYPRRDVPLHLRALESSFKLKVPSPTTLRALFTYYLEICAPLSRENVLDLAQFAPTSEARAFLLNLGQNKTAFSDFLTHTHLNLGRLLALASPYKKWTEIPLAYVVETLHPIQPRYYSISSSSVLSPHCPSITALVSSTALLANPTKTIPGVATNYLLALSRPESASIGYSLTGPADVFQTPKVFAHVRKSKFKLPALASTPIIMVAAGTGLAPFRAFVAERAKLAAVGRPVGEMILFFGCRDPSEDFIYREEIEQMQRNLEGQLQVITAFSRVAGLPKVYVQDRVREMGEKVIELMDCGAAFYICGRAAMAREVGKRVSGTAMNMKCWNDEQAKEWSENLKRTGKWREDVWG